jgi:hypothetical protein
VQLHIGQVGNTQQQQQQQQQQEIGYCTVLCGTCSQGCSWHCADEAVAHEAAVASCIARACGASCNTSGSDPTSCPKRRCGGVRQCSLRWEQLLIQSTPDGISTSSMEGSPCQKLIVLRIIAWAALLRRKRHFKRRENQQVRSSARHI